MSLRTPLPRLFIGISSSPVRVTLKTLDHDGVLSRGFNWLAGVIALETRSPSSSWTQVQAEGTAKTVAFIVEDTMHPRGVYKGSRKLDGDAGHTNTMPEIVRAALFRIAQELLTNVMRHAEASKVNLDLRQQDNFVVLTIQDNGRGITEREIGHGPSLGLLGIKERIAPFGGKLQIQGESGKGTRATVFIPLSS